jgi:eukaryotic-like serine/threonine-protein kinase
MHLPIVNSSWVELEHVIDSFEADLMDGEPPNLADYLPDATHPLYRTVLRELLCIDLDFAWQNGRPKRLAHYVEQFPSFAEDPELLRIVAIEEYRWRVQAGENPTLEEYASQYGIDMRDWPTIRVAHAPDAPPRTTPDHVSSPAAQAPAAASQTAVVADHLDMPQPGERFLGFELLQVLGKGAFAQVYLARQPEMAGRLVVLKVSTDGDLESQTLAQLQHTNIVPVYSLHRCGKLLAVCMPYFGATTLGDLLRTFTDQPTMPRSGAELVSTLHDSRRTIPGREPQPSAPPVQSPITKPARIMVERPAAPSQDQTTSSLHQLKSLNYVESVLWIGARLADGLAHAHERGILHRDLKPANVLLTRDGQPMLLDFNLAEDTKAQVQVRRALVGGTLPYMSPEQLQVFHSRTPVPIDGRSDVYSLGIILYELLAGRYPFALPTGTSKGSLWTVLVERQVVPSGLRDRNPQVSPAVEAIVGHCLEPEPAKRYQSARDLLTDLEQQLANRPLKVIREPSWRERATKWQRRHPRLASLTTLSIAAAVLLALVGVGYIARGKSLERLEALETLRTFEAELRTARGILADRDASEQQLEEGERLCAQALERYRPTDPTWRLAPRVRALPHGEQAKLLRCLDEVYFELIRAKQTRADARTDPEAKRPYLDEALALSEAAQSTLGEVPRALWEQRADLLELLKRKSEAHAARERATTIPFERSDDVFLLGLRHYHQRNYRQAQPLLQEATRRDPGNFAAWFIRGHSRYELMQDSQAVGCYNACISLRPDFAPAWFFRGVSLGRQRFYQEACADFDRVLELQPENQRAYIERAENHKFLKHYAEAYADLTTALEKGPRHNYIYLLRAKVRDLIGDVNGAHADRAQGLRSAPTDERSYVERGLLRVRQIPPACPILPCWGEPVMAQSALNDFEAALRLNANYLTALQNKAAILSDKFHRDEEALRVMDQTIAWYPESVLARGGRGVLLARKGERARALKDADEALLLDTQPPTLYQVACIYALTSRQVPADRLRALELLAGALRAGFGLEWIDTDIDLDPLRKEPEFQSVVAAAKALKNRAVAGN